MRNDLAMVLEDGLDHIVAGVVGRLKGRPEFLAEAETLEDEVRRCALALWTAAAQGEPAALEQETLALAAADGNPGRGYRRAQVLLDALCGETATTLRANLPRSAGRAAATRLRGLLGPAQVGLARVFRAGGAVSGAEGTAAGMR